MLVRLYTRKGKIKLNKTLFILDENDNKNFIKEYDALFSGEYNNRQLMIKVDEKYEKYEKYEKDTDFEYYHKRILYVLSQEIRKKKLKNIF